MDADNYFPRTLEETSSFNLENFFYDQNWSSLMATSITGYNRNTLMLEPENYNTKSDISSSSFQNVFSQRVHSRLDEYYKRKSDLFSKVMHSQDNMRNVTYNLSYLKNKHLEETAFTSFLDTSLPGLNPLSSWPVCLDELIERINKLEIYSLFTQPFDMQLNFYNQSKQYIENALSSKTLIQYLPKAIAAFICVTLLKSDIMLIHDMFVFLKLMESKYQNEFSNCFKLSYCTYQHVLNKLQMYYHSLPIQYPLLLKYELTETYAISSCNLFSPSKYFFNQSSSVTCDGSYLYLILSGLSANMLKVGTGYNGTTKGKVYLSKTVEEENLYQWVYLNERLYCKCGNSEDINVYDVETFTKVGKVKLLFPENVKHSALKKKFDNYVLLANESKLLVIAVEPVINQNTKHSLPNNLNPNFDDDDDSDQQYSVIYNNNTQENLYDTFTHVNVIMLTYNVDNTFDKDKNANASNTNKINSTLSLEKQNLIKELYESFSYYFSYENCHRVLAMFDWNFEKAAMYLIDNGENVKEDMLISETKEILYSCELEGTRYKNSIIDFVPINNNTSSSSSSSSSTVFPINSFNNLKWTYTGDNCIIAYKFADGECFVFKDNKYISSYNAIQISRNDYLLTYDREHCNYYLIANYAYTSQSVIVANLRNEVIQHVEQKIKSDLKLKEIDFVKDYTNDECNIPFKYVNELYEYIEGMFVLFGLRKNLCEWKYKNWNYFYTTYFDQTVVNRKMSDIGIKQMNSRLKGLTNKIDKFREINEKELFRQLNNEFPNSVNDYDLDLDGKNRKQTQSYESVPKREKVNWCSWDYIANFLFEKKKEDKEVKDATTTTTNVNDNNNKVSSPSNSGNNNNNNNAGVYNDTIEPKTKIKYLYLENKIETFFTYNGNENVYKYLINEYTNAKDSSNLTEKFIISYLYKVLCYIETTDTSLLFKSINKDNSTEQTSSSLNELENILHSIYTSDSLGTSITKPIIEAIILIGWEFLAQTLSLQIKWFSLFYKSSLSSPTPSVASLSLISNTSPLTNIYNIISNNSSSLSFYVLIDLITRLYKGSTYPISLGKVNNMKIYALTLYDNKIYGNTTNRGIKPSVFQTPFYYVLLDNQHLFTLREKHWRQTMFTIFKKDDKDNQRHKSRLGMLFSFAKMHSDKESYPLDSMFQISQFTNVFHHKREMFNGDNVKTFKEIIIDSIDVNNNNNNKDEVSEMFDKMKLMFYIQMEFNMTCELSEIVQLANEYKFNNLLLISNKHLRTHLFNEHEYDEDDETMIMFDEMHHNPNTNNTNTNTSANTEQSKQQQTTSTSTSSTINDFISFIFAHITNQQLIPAFMKYPHLYTFKNYLLFNALPQELISLTINDLIAVQSKMQNILSLSKQIRSSSYEVLSSQGFQIENEKVFEFTLTQGENFKCNETVQFPSALAIVVEFEIKTASPDIKPHFDLTLISKEHPYNNTNNNNYANLGTQFLIKLDSNDVTTTKYILKGNEMKLLTQPESSYRSRSQYKNNTSTNNKHSKIYIKIKCYPYSNSDYAIINPCTNTLTQINNEYNKLELMFYDMVNYYITLISKFLIRSVTITENESSLYKDKNILFLSKYGLANTALSLDSVFNNSVTALDTSNIKTTTCSIVNLIKDVHCGNVSEYIKQIKTIITHLDNNNLTEAETLFKSLNLIRKHIRDIVPEPRNYVTLKMLPSFNAVNKMYWNVCEMLFMICLFYHLNVISDVDKIKDEDYEPGYIEYIGKKMNKLILYLTGRVQYMKETYDSLKHYCEIIVDMFNECIGNIKKMVVDKITIDYYSNGNKDEKGKEDKKDNDDKKDSKDKEDDKDKGDSKGKGNKIKKGKMQIEELEKKFGSKGKNYKKKANVSRLYVELPKKKKKGVNKKTISDNNKPDDGDKNNKDDKDTKDNDNNNNNKDNKKKNENDLPLEVISTLPLDELFENFPQYKPEYFNNDIIQSLNSEILEKIDNDFRIAYYGNKEKIKSICEVYSIPFSESNINQSLREYSKVLQNKLIKIYSFPPNPPCKEITLDTLLPKVETESPYKNVILPIIDKLLLILEFKNNPHIQIKENELELSKKELSLTFTKSKISESTNLYINDIDASSLNIPIQAQRIVQKIFGIIQQNKVDIENTKFALYVKYIRNMIRNRGLELLCEFYTSTNYVDLFTNTYGLISSGLTQSGSNAIMLNNEMTYVLLEHNVKCIHHQLGLFNSEIVGMTITKNDYLCTVLKNLNLLLNDVNVILSNTLYYMQLEKNYTTTKESALLSMKDIITKALGIMINDKVKNNVKIMKGISEFVLNFRNFLSKLVRVGIVVNNSNSITALIIDSLLEALDKVIDFDNNISLISSLLDIIYHIMISIDTTHNNTSSNNEQQQQSQTTSSFIDSFSKGLAKLLSLILNSTTPHLVNLSVKIAKLFLKNGQITKETFINLFAKIGQLSHMETLSTVNANTNVNTNAVDDKRYNIIIEMNSPEIDYEFLVNALYQWEEWYPTSLSSYKKGIVVSKDNEINVVIPPGKEIKHFIPLKKKVTKTAHLENIVNKKITELNKRLTELSELLKQSKQDNTSSNTTNTSSNKEDTTNKDDKSNKKKKKNKDNSNDGDNSSSNKEPKKQLTLKEAQDCLNEVDLIQIKSQYLIRLLSHIKLCYKIGECASTRGYVILDNKYPKPIAEKFTKLIMTSFYDLSPSIPSETALNIDGTINAEKNTTPFFTSNDIHPPLYTMDELLPGCTNILKEITKPYLNCLLIESSTIYPKLFKSISLSSSKTTQDTSIRSSSSNFNSNSNSQQQQRNQQGNVVSSSSSSENTQHIVDCRFISGESITCIMDYIIDLIQHALNDHDKYKNVYESIIKNILEGKEKGKDELLGLFIYVSGGVNVIRQGSKCYCNDGSCVTVVNGGYESGMKTANVIFNNETNINSKEHKSNTTSTRVSASNVEYKIEKVNVEQLSKGYIDSKVLKLIDINYLIELFINLYTTNTNTTNSCSSSSSSHKIGFTHNIMLYILKLLSIVIHTPIDSMSLVSCDTFNNFYSIIKTINKDINWIHLTKTVLDHNLLMSFERRLTSTNELNYQIYAPLCIDIPLKQSSHQPQSNQHHDSIDMITNYTLPESTFVSQLPQIEDTSKSCLALKNIAQFERYTVEEVFNYAKSHYRDHEYLFYLRQVRQELSFNDIQNAKNDIYVIFDQSKVPPGMPLPLEHRDMKEIFKEECYPNNYYLAKMSHKLIRETGINSLLTVNNSNSKIISTTTSSTSADVDNNTNDNTQQQEHNNNDITSDNNTTSNLKEIPVLVLLVDNLTHQAFVMYNDYTYCNIHTFWIPLSNLSLLDFNMKLPPQSITQEQLDSEYNHAYEQLFNYYARCIMCSIYEKQIEAYKLNDLDDMTKFINLALWIDNIKDPLDGVLKKVKNYIQVKKKETNLDLNVKRFSSSRIDMVSPSNSNVYQPKFDINKVLTHINKKNPLSLLTSNTNTQSHLQCGDNTNEYDDTYMTPLSKIEIELNDNNEHFSLKNITSLCIDKIKSFSSNLLQIRFADLYNEYKQEISSQLFTITTMGTKLLSLHSLCNISNPNDYCACIISFEESGILGPNAKLTFYSDNTSQHVLKEVSSSKASRSSIESVLLLQSEIYMEYTEGTTAFYINDWDTQPRYSTLPCYITYIPYEWLLIEWLTDYCSSAVFDQGSYSTNEKLSVFQHVIKELLVLCTSLKIPAELQQNIFAITNRVLLKAIKFVSIEKCVVDRKAMSISEKFDLIGFDEVSFIGIIKNVDGCLKNKQTKNFSSSYIVDQVEIVLAILSFVQESYLTLELYLKEVFDYSLPLWVEAIIKLGNFLSFLQGNSSGLEENLMKEIKDIVDISKDTALIERNIFVIKDINYNKQQQLQTQTQQLKDVIEDESKILVTPIKEYDFIMDWATKKIEDELSEEKSNDKANDNVNDKDKEKATDNDKEKATEKGNEQHNEETIEDKEKIIKDKIIEIAKKMKCKIVNTNTDIQLLNNCTCAIILSDGFEVDELKDLPDDDEDTNIESTKKKEEEENKEQFWVCSCGFDNAMENEFCCACDKEKPELLPNLPQSSPKTKKQTLIKTEAYTLKIEDLSNDFIHALETEPLFNKSTNTSSYKVYNLSKMENNLKQQTLPLINKFLLKRLYELLLDDNYCNEYLSHLLKDKDNIISILKHQIKQQHNEQQHKELLNYLLQLNNNNEYDNDINNKLKSFDYFTYYTELQLNECIDIHHTNLKLQNETLMKSINLHLLERIRELIDVTLCKESKITYVYQTTSIRFIPETFPHTNHTPITILHNYYKDLVDISLINIRYYWAIIRYFNNCLISALPFIKPPDVYSQTTFNIKEDKDYLYIPFPKTISMFLSSFKGITFSVTKYNLINDVLSCTEFSAEEVQIPTFKFERLVIADKKQENANSNSSLVNNIQSNSNVISNESNVTLNERESLFLQAYEQGKDIDVAFYRSSKIPGDPHMGFKIEFKGELVQGLGGPYRQFFSDISNELIPSDKENRKLNLFCPTSNNKAQTGDYKDKYTITPSYNSNTQLNHYEFLGMLMGVCLRTSVHIPLDLCTMIWKKLTDTPITVDDIKEFDEGIIEQVNFLSEIDTDNFDGYNLTYCCELSDGTLYDLIPNGKYEKVLYEDRAKYMELFLKARLTEMDKQVAYIKKGLFKLIPPSLIKLLTNKELEAFVSGSLNKDVDIALLKSFTKYSNDLNEESKVIKWLWEIIEEMTVLERRKFIKFCWAQEKLPNTKDQYERLQVIFTIKANSNKNRKDVFPKADTCFFALELPDYTSKEVMKSKIISAINLDNVSINADKINNDHYESRDMNIQDEDSYEY